MVDHQSLAEEYRKRIRASVELHGFPVGTRVRVLAGPRAGRTGVVHRACGLLEPTRVVQFDRRPRERKVRREFEPVALLEALATEVPDAA